MFTKFFQNIGVRASHLSLLFYIAVTSALFILLLKTKIFEYWFPYLNNDFVFFFLFIPILLILTLNILTEFMESYIKKNKDQIQRADASELDQFEKRINKRVEHLIKNASLDTFLSKDVYKKLIDEKIGNDIITALDQALIHRTEQESKTIRLLEHLEEVTEELKIRLEGPAGTAEKASNTARRAAYGMALFGLGIASYRVYSMGDLTDTLAKIYEITKGGSIWPVIIAQSAPWMGLILLFEFTALLFVRFSTQASQHQRYFTEAYIELKDRHAALTTIIEYGTPEQIIVSARSMIVYGQRQIAESNDTETVSAASNLVQSMTGLIKETATRVGTK